MVSIAVTTAIALNAAVAFSMMWRKAIEGRLFPRDIPAKPHLSIPFCGVLAVAAGLFFGCGPAWTVAFSPYILVPPLFVLFERRTRLGIWADARAERLSGGPVSGPLTGGGPPQR